MLLVGLALLGAASCGGDDDGDEGGASTTTAKKTGGTLKINLAADTDHVDPALAYYQVSVQFLYSACTMLLNYPDKAGPEGARLQPEAAEAMPKVTPDGKTYTFTVREGFKMSPPSNEVVTADTFRAVIERNLNSKLQSPSASFNMDLGGANAFAEGKAKRVAGLTVAGNQLTIKLT